MKKKYQRKHIGEVWQSNEGYKLEIVDGGSKPYYCIVRIADRYEVEVNYRNVKEGRVKNLYHPSMFGKGYYGIGGHKTKVNGKNTAVYNQWRNILLRIYDHKEHERCPTYKDVKIVEEWHNFQVFADWYYKQPYHDRDGYVLDKDILSDEGNKIYSPDTCIFIPQALNNFMANNLSNNTSGFVGVHYNRQRKKYIARINIDGKQKSLGYYNVPEEASEAYKKAREEQAQKWKDKLKGMYSSKVLERII